MTTIEITYSESTLRNRCSGCKFLKLEGDEWFYGWCISDKSKVTDKQRNILSKKCVQKIRI
jgi:hypothetical protein